MRNLLQKRTTWAVLGVFAVLAVVVAWQRVPLLAWHRIRNLAVADEERRNACVDRVVALDVAALPGLLARLRDSDVIVCTNMQAALVALAKTWGPNDPRGLALAEGLRDGFEPFSLAGQGSALQTMASLLRDGEPPATMVSAAVAMIESAEKHPELHCLSINLASMMVETTPGCEALCRRLVEGGIVAESPHARVAAVQLAAHEPLRKDEKLLRNLVPLLKDKSAPVRRATLLTLGREANLIDTDGLLFLLHDDDVEVQHLCEVTLQSRGLSERDVQMARLISDEKPAARLRVLQHLGRNSEVGDVGVWLQKLSEDPSAAVRAAAVRTAGLHPNASTNELLRRMSQQDPSETVRLNAQHYLQLQATAAPTKSP
jgi:hypothetical protein